MTRADALAIQLEAAQDNIRELRGELRLLREAAIDASLTDAQVRLFIGMQLVPPTEDDIAWATSKLEEQSNA